MSQSERNDRREAKLQRAGGRLLHLALRGPEAAALDAIVKRDGWKTDRDAIGAAVLAYLRKRKPQGAGGGSA